MKNEILLEQFIACFDESNWFVALKNALAGVTPEQAAWKPESLDNSIWETINHLVFWNERYLKIWRKELPIRRMLKTRAHLSPTSRIGM